MSPLRPLRLALVALVCGCIFTSRPQLPGAPDASTPTVWDATTGVANPSDASAPPSRSDGGADFFDATVDAAASDVPRCPAPDDVRDASDDAHDDAGPRDASDDARDAGDASDGDDAPDPCHPRPDASATGTSAR